MQAANHGGSGCPAQEVGTGAPLPNNRCANWGQVLTEPAASVSPGWVAAHGFCCLLPGQPEVGGRLTTMQRCSCSTSCRGLCWCLPWLSKATPQRKQAGRGITYKTIKNMAWSQRWELWRPRGLEGHWPCPCCVCSVLRTAAATAWGVVRGQPASLLNGSQ